MTTEQEYIEYEKYKKAKGNLFVNLFKNITSFQFAGLIVLAGIFVYFLTTKNTKAVIGFGILIFITLIYLYSKSKAMIFVSEEQAKIILRDSINKKTGDELPAGTQLSKIFNCNLENDVYGERIWKVGFSLTFPNGLYKEYAMKIKLFGGEISGIIEMPLGYTGKEDKETPVKPVYLERYIEKEGT